MIEGKDLMLFVNGKSIAMAVDCTFNLSVEAIEDTSKTNGIYRSYRAGSVEWNVQSNNIVTNSGEGVSLLPLLRLAVAKTIVDVAFTIKAENTDTVPEGGWTPSADGIITGKAFITSISETATNGDVATFTISLQGTDDLII